MQEVIEKQLTKTQPIEDLFNQIEKDEDTVIGYDKIYYQSTPIKIKNEFDEWIDVAGLIKKKAKIFRITFDDLLEIEAADNHIIFDGIDNCIKVCDLIPGDVIKDIKGHSRTVIDIENTTLVDDVFDLCVNSDTHLYQTANGLIHHNTFEARKMLQEKLGPKGGRWVEEGGAMSSVDLYRYLYENNGKVILFDDLTGPLDDTTSIDILKKALDSNEPRTVSYRKQNISRKKKTTKRDKKILARLISLFREWLKKHKSFAEIAEFEDYEQAVDRFTKYLDESGKSKMDFESDDDEEIELEEDEDLAQEEDLIRMAITKVTKFNPLPPKFDFTGRIIFITNKKYSDINTALISRAQTVNVDFTPEQALQRVRSKIDVWLKEVPKKTKLDVLEYLLELSKTGLFKGKLDFRTVGDAVATWLCEGVPLRERKQWIYFSIKEANANR